MARLGNVQCTKDVDSRGATRCVWRHDERQRRDGDAHADQSVQRASARMQYAAPPRGLPRRSSRGSYLAGTITSRSLPDSAPQASPARPSICRTSALRRSDGKVSNFSVTGSNLTIALVAQSVSQTLSRSSTHTEYAWALPGNFHSRQDLLAGSYMPTCP